MGVWVYVYAKFCVFRFSVLRILHSLCADYDRYIGLFGPFVLGICAHCTDSGRLCDINLSFCFAHSGMLLTHP